MEVTNKGKKEGNKPASPAPEVKQAKQILQPKTNQPKLGDLIKKQQSSANSALKSAKTNAAQAFNEKKRRQG